MTHHDPLRPFGDDRPEWPLSRPHSTLTALTVRPDAALNSAHGYETDLAEPASLVARLNPAARFPLHIENVMPPVKAAFSSLRADGWWCRQHGTPDHDTREPTRHPNGRPDDRPAPPWPLHRFVACPSPAAA